VHRRARLEGNIVTDHQRDENFDVQGGASTHTDEPPQYGVGPFSLREVVLVGVWLVAFIVSFFSINMGRFESVWTSGLLWVLTIGLPSVAVFLIVLRRLSPQGIRRVGSLGIDQFASVAFSVSALMWLHLIWETVEFAAENGPWVRTWVIWVEFVLMLIGVLLTVFAPLIPPFQQDFRGRTEIPAHRNARPIRAVSPRPAVERRPAASDESGFSAYAPPAATAAAPDPHTPSAPVSEPAAAEPTPEPTAETAAWEPAPARDTFEPVEEPSSTVEPAHEPQPRHQAFWALVPEERDVVDEIGIPVFRIGPTAWALVIEDRGDVFVVRHEDGRIGYLHDVSGVTRG
jgi:hypothetical protein